MDTSFSSSLVSFKNLGSAAPVICFSHLRWDFVVQRPQHLMQRASKERPVFFFEEYIPTDHHLPFLEFHAFEGTDVVAVRPRVPHDWQDAKLEEALSGLLDQLLTIHRATKPLLWFYTPMMYPFAAHIDCAAVVYDYMDELSNFHFAPPQLRQREQDLMRRADVVFTGGYSIFEAKRDYHDNIHAFPSSVDVAHFSAARKNAKKPAHRPANEQPVLGYYGVIDERLDLDLIADIAAARQHWSFVMIGPVAKIDSCDLPRALNIHYLGKKDYADLPMHLKEWQVALMPFARNNATRFISPTKTLEYLAAGKPVVSTPIADVVRQYENIKGVAIAGDGRSFIAACEDALLLAEDGPSWLPQVDELLARSSWDETWRRMAALIDEAVARNARPAPSIVRDVPVAHPAARPAPWVRRSNRANPYDYLVVGAGFAGSVLAERLASAGKRIFLCDRRPHIAGNAYDYHDEAGILVHKYGPHIFHTNSQEVFAYLSRFTRWRPYEHRVRASVAGKLLPIPINRTTLNGLYGLELVDEAEAAAFLASRAEPVPEIRTSRDVVVSQVGTHLYSTFFEGYTRKQWGLYPSELDKSVAARIPARTSTDDRYFLDTFQAMPADGFTRLFQNMLDHDRIDIGTGIDYRDLEGEDLASKTIFTGPIDAFFEYRFGALPYRSLEFRHETLDMHRYQPVAVVNYPSEEVPYTRITEYKQLTRQVHPKTTISYEFAKSEGDPYYPVPRAENHALYKKYEALALERPDVTFVGRLGTYKYYNMDQVVGQALAKFRKMMETNSASRPGVAPKVGS